MAALTAEKYTVRYEDPASGTAHVGGGVASSTKIFKGALVVLNSSGYQTKATAATGLIACGVARETADNSSGSNGAIKAVVDSGAFEFENSSAGDAITIAEIGDDVYIVDDQTVAKTDGSGARSRAGKCVGFNSSNSKPIVRVGVGF